VKDTLRLGGCSAQSLGRARGVGLRRRNNSTGCLGGNPVLRADRVIGHQGGHPPADAGRDPLASRKPGSVRLQAQLPSPFDMRCSHRPTGGGGLIPARPQEKFATDSFFLNGMGREFSEDGRVRPPTGPARAGELTGDGPAAPTAKREARCRI
jgi:hypothetical protein